MLPLEKTLLASVSGGMRWQDFPRSKNIEDRRGWTPEQNRRAPIDTPPPLSLPPRTPGDLPSQAGLDDLIELGRRQRPRGL